MTFYDPYTSPDYAERVEKQSNTLKQASGANDPVNLIAAVIQATSDLAAGATIIDMIGSVRESSGLTAFSATTETEPVYQDPRPIGGGRIVRNKPIAEFDRLGESHSLYQVDGAKIEAVLSPHIIGHMAITTAIGIASIIGTLIPLLNLDRILEAIHSMYGLLDTPVIFSQIRDERLAIEWRRPYRYWIESQLQNNIPPTGDLISFLVREQITLDEFTRAMTYWGFSEEVSQMYWGAHWVMPTTEQVFDLLALGYIDEVTARQQLVINDISPEWVDKIFELRVRLPSRTELRLIMRRMKIPDELIQRIFDFERIHPDFQDYYKAMMINWDLDSINGKIATEALGQFVDGLLTEDEVRAHLQAALSSPLEIDRQIELAVLRRNSRRQESLKDRSLTLFKKGYVPHDAAINAIIDLGFNATDAVLWVDNTEVDQLPKLDITQYTEETEEESATEEE